MTNALATQIARLLNVSDVYKAKFVAQSGNVYEVHSGLDEWRSFKIIPEIWLESVRGT